MDGAASGFDGAEDGSHLGVHDGCFAGEEEGVVQVLPELWGDQGQGRVDSRSGHRWRQLSEAVEAEGGVAGVDVHEFIWIFCDADFLPGGQIGRGFDGP